MKLVGQALFWIGIIVGLICAAKNPEAGQDFSDMTVPFVIAVILSAIGSVVWRSALKKEVHSNHVAGLSMNEIKDRISSSLDAVHKLSNAPLAWDTLTDKVDEVLDRLAQVVESRTSLAKDLTIAQSATLMSDLARAERYLNRVWSMTSDGHRDEEEIVGLLKESHYSLGQVTTTLGK